MTLVDSSVWIDHLRRSDERLVALLEAGEAASHPFVIGEIALGHLKQRTLVLKLMAELPSVPLMSQSEVLTLIERARLAGRGIGWVDAHLLASALAGHAVFWTRDRRLAAVARELKISY